LAATTREGPLFKWGLLEVNAIEIALDSAHRSIATFLMALPSRALAPSQPSRRRC